MKFVVTGGAGFVGSHLVKLLIGEGHSVIVIDNLYNGTKENLKSVIDKIEFHKIDIRDFESMKKILKNIDGVFHQAALTVVEDSFERPNEYHAVNVLGTENIFKLAKENNFKVVYASSSSVYGHQQDLPISENAQRNPINPYGKTKLQAETVFKKYTELGTTIIGLRYFNIYGKGQNLDYAGVITKFLDRITKQKPPIIFGDGSQTRDFIFVGDVVKANLNAMTSNTKNLLANIGTGNAISILDLAEMVIDASGTPSEIIYEDALNGDIKNSQAHIDLAIKSFSWKPEMKLRSWLQTTIATLKNE